MLFCSILVGMVAAAAPNCQPTGVPSSWGGYQVVHGTAYVPLLGEVPTRTETYFLAWMQQSPRGIRVTQRTCSVKIARVAGVHAHLRDENVQRLPPASFTLEPQPLYGFRGQWQQAWNAKADPDGDGSPGVSIDVDVPLCGGTVYVSMRSVTQASANFVGDALEGTIGVRLRQSIVGASNPCLRLAAAGSRDKLHGTFVYRPVPAHFTCADVGPEWWTNNRSAVDLARSEHPRRRLPNGA